KNLDAIAGGNEKAGGGWIRGETEGDARAVGAEHRAGRRIEFEQRATAARGPERAIAIEGERIDWRVVGRQRGRGGAAADGETEELIATEATGREHLAIGVDRHTDRTNVRARSSEAAC